MVMYNDKDVNNICKRCRKNNNLKSDFKNNKFSIDTKKKCNQEVPFTYRNIKLYTSHDSYLLNRDTYVDNEWKTSSLPNNLFRNSDNRYEESAISYNNSISYSDISQERDFYPTSSQLFRYNFPTYDCQQTLDNCDEQAGLPSNSNYGVLFNQSIDLSRTYDKEQFTFECCESGSSTLTLNSTPQKSQLSDHYIRPNNRNNKIKVFVFQVLDF